MEEQKVIDSDNKCLTSREPSAAAAALSKWVLSKHDNMGFTPAQTVQVYTSRGHAFGISC